MKKVNAGVYLSNRILLAALVVLATSGAARCGRTIYVDDSAAGTNDGSSWANACNYLQDALGDANSADKPVQIRVAQGIYRPDRGSGLTPGDREATFQLIGGVGILGGYAGFGESDPDARDIELYKTILSGDLNGDDAEVSDPCDLQNEPTRTDNSYTVVVGSGTDCNAVIDGFTITAGWNDRHECTGPFCLVDCYGGGMYNRDGSPTVRNCTFKGNSAYWSGNSHPGGWGGGMCNTDDSNPTLKMCAFTANWADQGGGMYNENAAPTIIDCTFGGNAAGDGGGVFSMWGGPGLSNCAFSENLARRGGGLYNESTNLTLTGSKLHANSAVSGGGMINWACSPTITECVFTGNVAEDGGAVYNRADSAHAASPTLADCIFIGNAVTGAGGAICSDSVTGTSIASPIVLRCMFSQNSAGEGGALCNRANGVTNPTLANCLFVDNSATSSGGAIYNRTNNDTIKPALLNCTFHANRAARGGGIYNELSSPSGTGLVTVADCILRGDTPEEIVNVGEFSVAVTFSDIQDGWPGEGNMDTDPCFADPQSGDYHLRSEYGRWDQGGKSWVQDSVTSPCVDQGDPNSHVACEPWPHGKRINMGAYGGTPEASMSWSALGTIADLNNDDIVDFPDFAHLGGGWWKRHSAEAGDLDRNAIVDFEDVRIFAADWLIDNRPLPVDDFNDNTQGPLWAVESDDPANCWVEQINQRLEVRATADANYATALYVSDGWALDVDADFSFRVVFHYSRVSEKDGWIMIHVAPISTDDPNNPHVELSAGYAQTYAYFWYEVVAASGADQQWTGRSSNDGTFYVSYNSTADELYVSYTGYGSENAFRTASGLLKGVWGGSAVRVKLGGGSIGAVLDSGDAYLDDFVVESGSIR